MKRGRFEIMAEILQACEEPKRKTHIMYSINLSYTLLLKYLAMLTTEEFLRLENPSYVTTKKGTLFLQLFRALRLLERDKQQLSNLPTSFFGEKPWKPKRYKQFLDSILDNDIDNHLSLFYVV